MVTMLIPGSYGPVYILKGDGVQMHWRSNMNNPVALQKTMGVENQFERKGFHNVFFPNEQQDVIEPI